MLSHPQISILAINAKDSPELDAFFRYLQSMAHVKLALEKAIPADLSPYGVVISADTTGGEEKSEDLEQFAAAGGGWLKLVYRSARPLPEVFGAQPGQIGPAAELRVLFDDPDHPLAGERTPHVAVTAPQRDGENLGIRGWGEERFEIGIPDQTDDPEPMVRQAFQQLLAPCTHPSARVGVGPLGGQQNRLRHGSRAVDE